MLDVIKFKRAKARIEKGWCQKHLALAADGCPLFPERHWYGTKWWREEGTLEHRYDQPVQYCMRGALLTASSTHYEKMLRDIVEHPSITMFNDSVVRTKEEVLAVFDRAIEAARKTMRWYERPLYWVLSCFY